MSKILWNQAGMNRYEAGIDRGVLYKENNVVVAWNGLIDFEEEPSNEDVESYYLDGIQYLNVASVPEFQGTLTAYTYPDEFLACEGISYAEELLVDNQYPEKFNLSFRSLIGNDIAGIDYGTRIHVLYNLIAISNAKPYSTISENPELSQFSWALSSIPSKNPGHWPTTHLMFDTAKLDPYFVIDLEEILYGSDERNPELPTLEDFITFARGWAPLQIIDHGDGTWTAKDHGEYITVLDPTTFQIDSYTAEYLDINTYIISNNPG